MPRISRIRRVFLLCFGGAVLVSQAASIEDARNQYHAGKFKPALEETNTLLKANPKSISALFLKAQIQSDSQRTNDAIKTYKQLIAIDAGHLQAYNNLAALYAQQGKLKLASETLEQAIRTDPVYTTIHTNLRAIYMDMSKKNYRQALKLKPENKSTQIASIDIGSNSDQILSEEIEVVPPSIQDAINTTISSRTVVARRPLPKPDIAPVATKSKGMFQVPGRKTEAIKVSKAEVKTSSVPEAIPVPKPKPAAGQAAKAKVVSEAKPKAKPKPKPKPKAKPDPAHEVKKSLLSWANAWSNRDSKRYVSAYVKNYATPGKTHKDWAAGRRWNFKNKKYIKVSLSGIRIKPDGKRFKVQFKQKYESNSYQDEVNKEIELVHQGGRWKIASETSL